jgi:hypothetical protein
MNRALTRPEKKENVYGWTISRYRFFFTAAIGSFCYYWFPGYLFKALSQFNWMTWIAPTNKTLALITGSGWGLGMLNPITTFDWNWATSSYSPLAQPFWVILTMYCSSMLGGFILLGIYLSNMYYTKYLPPNSSSAFANDGTGFNVHKIIVNNKLDEKLYQQYSPPFYTAGNVLTVGANFAFYRQCFSIWQAGVALMSYHSGIFHLYDG